MNRPPLRPQAAPNPATPPDASAARAAGQGMPVTTPRAQAARAGRANTPKERAVAASLELPHECDQAVDMTAPKPDPVVTQASRDVSRGLLDTSKGAEMDRAYQKLRK